MNSKTSRIIEMIDNGGRILFAAVYLGIVGRFCFWDSFPPPEERPLAYQSTLTVNTKNTQRTIVVKSEEEGIRDIRELADGDTEEAWAYLPATSTWVEIGNWEQSWKDENSPPSVRIGYGYLFSLFDAHDAISVYHLHPGNGKASSIMRKKYEAEIGREFEIGELLKWRKYFFDLLALPSENDVKSMDLEQSHFYGIHPPGKISHRICSPRGITVYNLTAQGRARAVHDYVPLWVRVLFANPSYSPSPSFGDSLEKLLSRANTEDVEVRFRSYDEPQDNYTSVSQRDN